MNDSLQKSLSFPRVAVVGCGAWGKNLIRNFAELKALVAVCDIDPVKGQSLASQYNVPSLSEEEVFAHPSIDAVVIASVAPLHAKQVEKALLAGKHVYVEKPMALSVKEAKKLCALAISQNRLLMVGHLLHYHPAFEALKAHVVELGPLKHIYANRLSLGRFRRKENVLWDLASHDISLILALSQEMPQGLTATGQAFLSPGKPANALLTLDFSNNLTAHVHASWLSPFKEQKLVIIGEQGIAVFDDQKPWSEKLQISTDYLVWKKNQPYANNDFETRRVPLKEAEPLRKECLHFLTCIQKEETPLTPGQEGLRVIEVLEKAEASLKGQPLPLSV